MALFSQNIETDFRGIFRLDNSKLKKAYAKAVKEESEARRTSFNITLNCTTHLLQLGMVHRRRVVF